MPRKKKIIDRKTVTVKRNIVIPNKIDELINSESIERNISINQVMVDKIYDGYANNTLVHKKLDFIIKEIFKKKKLPIPTNEEFMGLDKPKINSDVIKASKYKPKYVKKHWNEKKTEELKEPPIDVLNMKF